MAMFQEWTQGHDWDAHCHLAFLDEKGVSEVLSPQRLSSGSRYFQGGYLPDDWLKQLEISKKYPHHLVTAYGLHPWALGNMNAHDRELSWAQLLEISPSARLIGETGLDHSISPPGEERTIQEDFFIRHLELARQLNLPLVLHVVQAHGQALEILKNHALPDPAGIVHAFNGSFEIAQQYVKRGFLISIGPNLLKNHFKRLKESVMNLELKDLVIESDSPSLALPQSQRKYRAGIIHEIARTLGTLKGLSTKEVLEQNRQNLQSLIAK